MLQRDMKHWKISEMRAIRHMSAMFVTSQQFEETK